MDAAAGELLQMRTRATGSITGKNYGTLGEYLWYRHTTADGLPAIEMYGIHLGETGATETSCLASGTGWQPYTNSEGAVSKYIDEESFTSDSNKLDKATSDGFYDNSADDPNIKQYWPIPQTTIINSQGTLYNDYGY